MSTPTDPISLSNWRREVAEMYAAVRRAAPAARAAAWQQFCAARAELFRTHPQSPLEPGEQAAFTALPYHPYEPDWRVLGEIDTDVSRESIEVDLPQDGAFVYTRIARVHFSARGHSGALSLFWIEGYGGGLFLPFRDATNGQTTYGGGRYLYDTIKGADLRGSDNSFVLDFNYAYNPSCAYSPRWGCPLPPAENRLSFAVEAGERAFRSLDDVNGRPRLTGVELAPQGAPD